jgi:hypothetical protein
MTNVVRLRNGAAICALLAAAFMAAPASANIDGNLKIINAAHHDTSLPLRDMIREYNKQHAHDIHVGHHEIPLLPGPATKHLPATVADGIKGPGFLPGKVATTDLLNFDGLNDTNSDCSCAPPDTNGAVGATQYVQWVNSAFAIYNKTTGALISGPTAGNALWQGFAGRCQSNNNGDPIAQYDKVAGRWVMQQPVFSNPYKMCVAVSTTSDATGSYNRYEFDFANVFPDYPKLGVWPVSGNNAYFLSVRDFLNGQQFQGSQPCAMDRAAMLAGSAATMQCKLISGQDGVLPQDFDGTTLPPAGADELFANHTGTNKIQFWRMHVDFANPNNTTLSSATGVTVPSFSQAGNVPQKGTTTRLDALAGFTMYRLAYRNFGDHESIVATHSVSVNGRAAVRWYEFRTPSSPTLFQSGNVKNKTLHYWAGSIAMDKAGNMAVGYSTSSANDFPGINYSGRALSDNPGKMKKHAGGNTTNGTGSQTDGLTRWGDYSAMSVDPTDDCTMYYTTEYLKTTGSFNWSTKVNSFKFNNCT